MEQIIEDEGRKRLRKVRLSQEGEDVGDQKCVPEGKNRRSADDKGQILERLMYRLLEVAGVPEERAGQ